jgi:hypothetical protein
MPANRSWDPHARWDPLAEREDCRETYATLVLAGDSLDARRITTTLGIEPDESWHEGDTFTSMHSRSEGRRLTGMWQLSSRNKISSTSLERHIAHIFERLEGREHRLNQLAQEMKLFVRISCFWVTAVGHDGPILSPELLRRIGEIGASLWIDFYDGSED